MNFFGLSLTLIITFSTLISILHIIFFFLIKKTDFKEIFGSFDSSPLFDFEVKEYCSGKSHLVLHTWEGRIIKTESYTYTTSTSHRTGTRRKKTVTKETVDVTDIELINGKHFCYDKSKTYRDLLYNGQIIKENEQCKENYKSCGIIDTLNQILCVKNEENCPLKDIHFGQNDDLTKYTYDADSDISYNNNNYDGNNKIIGRLILNDGQPCLSDSEKLWKKFVSEEAGDGHLKCKKKLKNVENDERYEAAGQITYRQLYIDNLNDECKNLVLYKTGLDTVTLYKREFLGIDKECDEKSHITNDVYKKINNNQKKLRIFCLVEGILLFIITMILIPIAFRRSCIHIEKGFYIFTIVLGIFYIAAIISNSIFTSAINKNDFEYKCSDEISNEFFKKQNNNTKKSYHYGIINIMFDVLLILLFIILLIIRVKVDIKKPNIVQTYENKVNYNNNQNNNLEPNYQQMNQIIGSIPNTDPKTNQIYY